jgi:hypothetical protein
MTSISPEHLRFASTIAAIAIISTVDLTQPHLTLMCRIAFGIAQAVTLLVCYYVFTKISVREEGNVIRVINPPSAPWKKPDPESFVEMTEKEYDREQLRKFAQQTAISTGIITFISYNFEAVPPLLFTALSAPAALLSTPILRAYLFDSNTERPFKEESSGLWKLVQQYTDSGEEEEEEQPKKPEEIEPKKDEKEEEEEEEKEEEKEEEEEKKKKKKKKKKRLILLRNLMKTYTLIRKTRKLMLLMMNFISKRKKMTTRLLPPPPQAILLLRRVMMKSRG